MDIYIKSSFNNCYSDLKNNIHRMFIKSAADIFNEKSILFREILYNPEGSRKYFLVRNFQGKWIIINRRLKMFGDYKFDELLNEKEGVFTMKVERKEFYIYIYGDKPRVNIRIN